MSSTVWPKKEKAPWFKKQEKQKAKATTPLAAFIPQIHNKAGVQTYTRVESAIMKLGNEFILSFDIKATEEEIVLQKQSGYTIYYYNEWYNLFNSIDINILRKFIREDQICKDIELLDIIAEMCKYGKTYNESNIQITIKPYMKYLYQKNNLHLPKIVVIQATPPGKSISNCEEHIKSKIEPKISGNSLIHLFPGANETGIRSLFIIRLLNNLTNNDRLEISKNLKGWLESNPNRDLTKILKSNSVPVKIPYYKSICLCKKCKFTVSDSGIDKFLEEITIDSTSFRLEKCPELILKTKPRGDILSIAKKFLYIQCSSCFSYIAISSIIPKYLDMSKDEKTDESYKIAEKAKLYLYKIICELSQKTLDRQFPDLTCCVCLTENLSYDSVFQNQECNHLPCICLDCNEQKHTQGIAIKGKFYENRIYQCLSCTAFEPSGNLDIDEFNKNGGVQPGYVGRFCYECIKPFQAKPETCGVEQGNTDISEYCIDCTIKLAEYNKSIRLTVNCPNPICNTPISRYDGCDVVECMQCHMQFCYGCEYMFINPPDYEWNWSCSCLIDYRMPKKYNDKSQSTCEDKYIDFQERRGIIIPRQSSQPIQQLEPVQVRPHVLGLYELELETAIQRLPDSEPVPEPIGPEPILESVPEPVTELLPELLVPALEPVLPITHVLGLYELELETVIERLPNLDPAPPISEDINIDIINIVNNPIFQERILDEEDIQRQILLAEDMGDNIFNLY